MSTRTPESSRGWLSRAPMVRPSSAFRPFLIQLPSVLCLESGMNVRESQSHARRAYLHVHACICHPPILIVVSCNMERMDEVPLAPQPSPEMLPSASSPLFPPPPRVTKSQPSTINHPCPSPPLYYPLSTCISTKRGQHNIEH